MKPPRLGSINPCGSAVLFDARGLPVVACHDTPNAVQVAFETYPQAVKAQAEFNGGTRAERTGRCLSDDQRVSLRRNFVVLAAGA